jgi:hypothetical protein
VLSGDIHHYRRETEGPTLHVTSGGGGAFLHPAAIASAGGGKPTVEWPGVAQSKALLWQVPWKVALGRSGFIPHLVFAALLIPLFTAASGRVLGVAAVTALVVTFGLSLMGGFLRRPAVIPVAVVPALFTVAFSVLARLAPGAFLSAATLRQIPEGVLAVAGTALGAVVGAFSFGAFLALLTRFGIENTQAFTALDHPGFKHFVRLRVRADGTVIHGFVFGLVDPVRPGEKPVLVDTFTWRSR